MKILKIKLIGAALFFASTTAFAEPTYFAVNGIPDASSLVLRAWPSASSQPIGNIPHNAVKIEATGKDIIKENKKWLQVTYQNKVGWTEAGYLSPIQASPTQTNIAKPTQVTETVNNAAAFNYSQQASAASQQPAQQNIPWTAEQDTIYDDPTGKQLAAGNLIETVDATHTLVVINKNQEAEDLRGENLAGNRYESIEASMSVQYQP